jgi:YD repeat-containing protein
MAIMKKLLILIAIIATMTPCFAQNEGKTVYDGNTIKHYDSQGKLTDYTVQSGNTTTYYDADGNVKGSTERFGNTL